MGKEVESICSKCPMLSQFGRKELIDGDTIVPFTLHRYLPTATHFIGLEPEMEQKLALRLGNQMIILY